MYDIKEHSLFEPMSIKMKHNMPKTNIGKFQYLIEEYWHFHNKDNS